MTRLQLGLQKLLAVMLCIGFAIAQAMALGWKRL